MEADSILNPKPRARPQTLVMSDHRDQPEKTPEKDWESFPDWDENTPTPTQDERSRGRSSTAPSATDKTAGAAPAALRPALNKTSHSRSLGDLNHPVRDQPTMTSAQSEQSLLSTMAQVMQEAFKFGWNASGSLIDQRPQTVQTTQLQRETDAELDEFRKAKTQSEAVILQEPKQLRRNSGPTAQEGQDKNNGLRDPRYGSADRLAFADDSPPPPKPNALGAADTKSSEEVRFDFRASPEHLCKANGRKPSDGEEKGFSPQSIARIKKNMLAQQEKQIQLEEEVAR